MEHDIATTSRPAISPERSTMLRMVSPDARTRSIRAASLVNGNSFWGELLGSPAPSAAECAALEALAQERSVAQGTVVFNRAEAARNAVAVRSGEVALGFRTADGTFRTERIVRGPAWLDLASGWLGNSHAMDAQAWTVASVVELPCDALQAQFEHLPGLPRHVIRGLANEVQALAVNTHELMHKDAPARLAQWLHQRCEPAVGDEAQAVVRLADRKRDVASQLAITPETLSRLMRSFTRRGVIEVAGYTVRVLDVAALKALAQA